MTPKPKSLLVSITQDCNLRCIHCSTKAGEHSADELTLEEIIELVLRPCIQLGTEQVTISGGEPLLPRRKEVCLALLEYCSQQLKVDTILDTNGTLVTDRVALKILETGLSSAWVPLYGVYPNSHDMITQVQGSFQQAVEGLKALVRNGVDTGVIIVPMRETLDEQALIISLVRKLGVSKMVLFRLTPAGRAIENWGRMKLTPEQTQALAAKLKATAEMEGIVLWAGGFNTKQAFPSLAMVSEDEVICGSYQSCGAGADKMYVNSLGNVFPCTALESEFAMAGNVHKNSIQEIWNKSSVFQLMRYFHVYPPFPCNACNRWSSCGGDCRAQVFGILGNLTLPNPECPRVIGAKSCER